MELEAAANLTPLSVSTMLGLGLGGPVRKSMVFLINFAWASRIRLPILILVGFMIFDVRMQLEINVDVELRQVPHNHDSDTDTEDDSTTGSDEFESEEEFSDA